MKNKIMSKSYGEGIWTGYDPRFPGYFSGVFNIKGRDIEIHNLKSSDIIWVSESEYCEKINCNFTTVTFDEHYEIINLKIGEKVLLNRFYFFHPQESFDLLFNERYYIKRCPNWWDESDVTNEFDIKNKFTKFNYHATNN